MVTQPPSLLLSDHPVGDAVGRMARELRHRHGDTVAAILFYGSCLRDQGGAGILDFYVLVDDYRSFHDHPVAVLANAILPPSVGFVADTEGAFQGAKVTVISRDQFATRVTPDSLDTTIWARFCQPAVLVHCRNAGVADWVAQILSQAAVTAMHWAVHLGPDEGRAEDFWINLFRHTYGVELRVEGAARAAQLYGFSPALFDAVFAALAPAGIERRPDGRYRLRLDGSQRRQARRRWFWRRIAGKILNVLRLTKALFTFDGGIDYIVGKLERHSGQHVALRPWQRRYPLLAAPGVLWSLYRRGVIR
ncbi:MAG: hypothetical protein AB7G62_17825 [Magnetospirillum sp.]